MTLLSHPCGLLWGRSVTTVVENDWSRRVLTLSGVATSRMKTEARIRERLLYPTQEHMRSYQNTHGFASEKRVSKNTLAVEIRVITMIMMMGWATAMKFIVKTIMKAHQWNQMIII